MGRKKKKPTKPWCWYCNREFDDEKILIQHQKAKHYKCHVCHKKLYTGPGLAIHCMQVHKEMIDKIPNALPNRNSVDIEIYGMQGIPEDDVREHEKNRGNDGYIPPPSTSSSSIPKPSIGPGLLPHSMTMSGPPPPIPHFPGMPLLPPGLPPLPPGMPPLPPGLPPHGTHFPGHPPPAISINLPRKPLFPSASAIVASQPTISTATVAKPSSSVSSAPPPSLSSSVPQTAIQQPATTAGSSSSANLLSTGNPMSRIIHPGEDISLEELRGRREKYQKQVNTFDLAHPPQMPSGIPTGPPPAFHIPPPGYNPQVQLPGRRWDAPPPSQPTFQSTFKPAY